MIILIKVHKATIIKQKMNNKDYNYNCKKLKKCQMEIITEKIL